MSEPPPADKSALARVREALGMAPRNEAAMARAQQLLGLKRAPVCHVCENEKELTSLGMQANFKGIQAELSTGIFECGMCCPIPIDHPAASNAVARGWMYENKRINADIYLPPTAEALLLQETSAPKLGRPRLAPELSVQMIPGGAKKLRVVNRKEDGALVDVGASIDSTTPRGAPLTGVDPPEPSKAVPSVRLSRGGGALYRVRQLPPDPADDRYPWHPIRANSGGAAALKFRLRTAERETEELDVIGSTPVQVQRVRSGEMARKVGGEHVDVYELSFRIEIGTMKRRNP